MSGWGPRVIVNEQTGGGSGVIDLTDTVLSVYDDVSAVAPSVPTVIITYVVPTIVATYPTAMELMNVEFGGTNIARYYLLINDVVQAQHITWFNGGGLNGTWDFRSLNNGIRPNAGDTIKVSVTHERPPAGDFYARLNLLRVEDPPV